MNKETHLIDLYGIYQKQLEELHEKYEFEKTYFYHVAKSFVQIYEEEESLKEKLDTLKHDILRDDIEKKLNE